MHWFSGLVCGLGHASGLGSGAELNPRCLKLQSPTEEVCGFNVDQVSVPVLSSIQEFLKCRLF
jgi:hypothetical protein